jgi:glycosyltransferase involved in cell wall biosynthesis
MRIAVVDHVSAGGVSRFVANLIDGLARSPGMAMVTYFVASSNVERDHLAARWSHAENVELRPIAGAMDDQNAWHRSAAVRFGLSAARVLRRVPGVFHATKAAYLAALRVAGLSPPARPWYEYSIDAEVLGEMREHDLVYLAWPYFIEPFDVGRPMVATFHDFHFERFPEAYHPDQLEQARRQTAEWLERVEVAVTSTKFVSSEIDRHFTVRPRAREVVYLAPYTTAAPAKAVDEQLLGDLGIQRPYMIYSGGTSSHKNVLGLFRGRGAMPEGVPKPMLVMTGIGTQTISAHDAGPDNPISFVNAYIREHGLLAGRDYLALGYVAESTVDELTRGADLVVSASLYEAGCGPALDAWQLGAPVAMSNIPPFMEQMDRFGVEAFVFDPNDPQDIARAVTAALTNPVASRDMAERSQQRMLRYTSDDVTAGYLRVFAQAMHGHDSRDCGEHVAAIKPSTAEPQASDRHSGPR